MITSTPNSDEDQFAMIWKEANKRFDEYGNDKIVGTMVGTLLAYLRTAPSGRDVNHPSVEDTFSRRGNLDTADTAVTDSAYSEQSDKIAFSVKPPQSPPGTNTDS